MFRVWCRGFVGISNRLPLSMSFKCVVSVYPVPSSLFRINVPFAVEVLSPSLR